MGNLCSSDDNTITPVKKSKISEKSFKRVIGHHSTRYRIKNRKYGENEMCRVGSP